MQGRAEHHVLDRRRAGVLAHLTSLPGPGTHGHMGAAARRFIAFLAQAGFTVWQLLPVGPRGGGGSPYQSSSVFAGDPTLLDPDALAGLGLIEIDVAGAAVGGELDAGELAERAFEGFERRGDAWLGAEFEAFVERERYWLDDYALYCVLRAEHRGAPWTHWPAALRDRESSALAAARSNHGRSLARIRFEQFLFDIQWQALRREAGEAGIRLFGDLPIFVARDSADVWAHKGYFRLDEHGDLAVNTGVPPDYFSADGQLWHMPHYDWPALAADGYRWWEERLRRQLWLFDMVRIDHFRGFAAAWEVPAGDLTARNGQWRPGPGRAMFDAIGDALGELPLVAEDLGYITEDVHMLRDALGLPGMRVLQFAFDGDSANPHLPHEHHHHVVVYTGTHDNDTTLGWWRHCAEDTRWRLAEYLNCAAVPMPDALNRLALASVARLAVLPLQDLLALDSQARMNTPGTATGNWQWRAPADALTEALARELRDCLQIYGRLA